MTLPLKGLTARLDILLSQPGRASTVWMSIRAQSCIGNGQSKNKTEGIAA